ncbi:hypothetical protein M431DRAFT_4306 [Trichoderma harzianum CBS 226.95]|uniref:Uncharacterized protein n=1 Tax=Trichoderma harzianum CBS 226.95 TaxID=983964 RepID=A0A2T4AJI0_TRIHA|nr:hypothetical protein M431DRAFT_4306 [Trichoderma harzianum CBS 226.95]PTB57244.1 hypothetical protein M431DRAFT_4306 [Trichoderma harzianum CBS 226.95]
MTATKLAGLSTLVFVAELRTLIITNFLGVTMAPIRARSSRPWFGANSAAICSGLAANDVVIDNVDKNCSVMLEFTSGYVIAQQPTSTNCAASCLAGTTRLYEAAVAYDAFNLVRSRELFGEFASWSPQVQMLR